MSVEFFLPHISETYFNCIQNIVSNYIFEINESSFLPAKIRNRVLSIICDMNQIDREISFQHLFPTKPYRFACMHRKKVWNQH